MLATFSLLSTLAFIGVGATVGTRLIVLAGETRGFAELSLGVALLSIVGIGYPLYIVGSEAVASDPEALWPRLFLAGGHVLLYVGWLSLWLFTWRTFRADAAWARAAVYAVAAAIVGITCWRVGAVLAVEDPTTLAEPTLDAMGVQYLALVVYAWTAVESLRYWGLLRRRVPLGLADPVVANRFLLWAIMGVFSLVSLVVPVGATLLRTGPEWVPAVRLVTALSGLVCAAVLYLGFLPPDAYRSWVQRGAAPA